MKQALKQYQHIDLINLGNIEETENYQNETNFKLPAQAFTQNLTRNFSFDSLAL